MLKTRHDAKIPLKSQNVDIDVKDRYANFTVSQNYLNDESNPIEVFYTFPTPAEGSVYHFEAKTDDGIVIKSFTKEKTQAKKDYNDAIKSGNTSYYMDRSDGNVFNVAIGNLASKTGIMITLKFVIELSNEENNRHLRLNIPLTIMHRYTPSYQNTKFRSNDNPSVNPPKISNKPYSQNISGDIYMSDNVISVDSKTHKIKLSKMKENSVHFDIEDLENLDRDIVITIERGSSKTDACFQEFKGELKDKSLRFCTMLNIVPDFAKMSQVNVNNVHYIILLDKSGSMDGQDMINCRLAAQNFVAFMPVGATFDVYAFDNTYSKFIGQEKDINQRKIEASKWIDTINADGGTEIVYVLEEIYSVFSKMEKNGVLIVLSDGGVSNTDDVLKLVKKNSNVSVFTIGIGSNVSQDLIKGLATNGNGHAEFVGSGDKNIVQKVRAQLKKSQDSLRKFQKDYSIEYNLSNGLHREVPSNPPALYEGNDNTLYMFSEFEPIDIKFTETFIDDKDTSQKQISTRIIKPIKHDDDNYMFHHVASIKLLNELQQTVNTSNSIDNNKGTNLDHMKVNSNNDNNDIITEMINISTDMNVLCKYTAFIGVEHKLNKVDGKMELREVPLQITKKERGNMEGCFSSGYINKSLCHEEEDCDDFSLFGDGCEGSSSFDTCAPPQTVKTYTFASACASAFAGGASASASASASVTKMIKNNISIKSPIVILDVPLNGVSLSGGLIVGSTNGSFVDILHKLLKKTIKINVGDVIKLTTENDSKINGLYEIITIGNNNEPYVLQLVNNN